MVWGCIIQICNKYEGGIIIKKYVLLLVIIIAAVLIGSGQSIESVNITKKSAVDLSFSVLSDIHKNSSHLQDAIEDLYNINPELDALVLNGDTVDEGLDYEYEEIRFIQII